MASNEREVKYKLTGDASGFSAALNAAEAELDDLAKVGKQITVLEGALSSVKAFESELTVADAKVRQLKATLNEAYNSGAEAPQIRDLERQLAAAERAAQRTETALQRANTEVVRLNLESSKTGVSTSNLAQRNAELAAEISKVQSRMSSLGDELKRTAAAEEMAAARAGRVNQAFSNLNIRSANQINADILQINNSLGVLARSTKVSGDEFDRAYSQAQQEIRKLKTELSGVSPEVEKATKATGGLMDMVRQLGPAISAAFVGEQFLKTNVELENLQRTFQAITGSSEQAGKELEYVRGVSDRLGINALDAAKAYGSLMAATKGTAVEGAATSQVFESVARAMSLAGKSSADTEGALLALQQIASKGVVSMEELRGQLGERLPGALQATANGLGITTQELIKLVESGKLTADEVFPALAKGLNSLYKDAGTETLAQEWEHFKNAVGDAFKTIGDSGVVTALKFSLEGLGAAITITSAMLVAAGKDVGIFFAALANGEVGLNGFSARAKQAFAEVEAEARDKLVKASMHNQTLAATLDEAGQKALAMAKEQANAAAQTQAAGAAADGAVAGWTKLNVVYADIEKKAAEAATQAEKNAEARKAEAAASDAVANAFGTETEKRLIAADSARNEAEALTEVARLRTIELETMKAHLAALQAQIPAGQQATEQQQKVIDDLEKEIGLRQAATDKANAQAQSAQLLAAQTSVASQALADNSGRLVELRANYEQARAALDALIAQEQAGIDVTKQLDEAERQAGAARQLYIDAIQDQINKIKVLNDAKQGEINVAQAGIRLQIEQQQTILQTAKARGDEYTATQAVIKIKELEIKLAELTAQAKKAEAAAALEAVKAKREELAASGQLTPAKEAELKAQEASAKVKQIEGEIAGETAKRMKELVDVTDSSSSAANKAASSYDDLAKSIDGVANSADKAGDSIEGLNNKKVTGGTSSGSATTADVGIDWLSLVQRAGATNENSDKAIELAKKNFNEIVQSYKGNFGTFLGYRNFVNAAFANASQKAVQELEYEAQQAKWKEIQDTAKARAAASSSAPGATASPTGAASMPSPSSSSVTTVNINLGGAVTRVNVASQADASALTAILKQLESAARSAY